MQCPLTTRFFGAPVRWEIARISGPFSPQTASVALSWIVVWAVAGAMKDGQASSVRPAEVVRT